MLCSPVQLGNTPVVFYWFGILKESRSLDIDYSISTSINIAKIRVSFQKKLNKCVTYNGDNLKFFSFLLIIDDVFLRMFSWFFDWDSLKALSRQKIYSFLCVIRTLSTQYLFDYNKRTVHINIEITQTKIQKKGYINVYNTYKSNC